MQLPRSSELTVSRGGAFADPERLSLRALTQFGHILALPFVALGSGAYRMLAGPSPSVSGAVSTQEAWIIRRRLRAKIDALRATGASFSLSDVLPFRCTRLGVFAPMEDVRSYFPSADERVVELLEICDRHVVVLQRTSDALVYLTFGPADDVPSAAGAFVEADRIVVSRVSRDFIDYLDFAAAPSSVVG